MKIKSSKRYVVILDDPAEQFVCDTVGDGAWTGLISRLVFDADSNGDVWSVEVSGMRMLKNGRTNSQRYTGVVPRGRLGTFNQYPEIQHAVNVALREG